MKRKRRMEGPLRNFFESVYQIIGFDIQADRERMIARLEEAALRRAVADLVEGLSPSAKGQYEKFITRKRPASARETAEFLRGLVSAERLDACFKEGIRAVVQKTLSAVLQVATEQQKTKIKEALGELFGRMDPAQLRAVLKDKKLSTPRT